MSAIDPGVDSTIEATADDVERARTEDEDKQQEEEDFFVASRWWFASTACPLMAGTFGPMATAFNICALSTHWREVYPPKGTGVLPFLIEDPGWLLAINSLSLVSAIVANGALLLNMARRVKFSIAQPLTIVGFFLAGILLVACLTALTATPDYMIPDPEYRPGNMHGLSSAFYFAIFAAANYIFISLLMCITVVGAIKGHYDKQFKLTSSQRTLMLQTMSFMTYLLLGAVVFNSLEGWGFLTSVYWADVTLLTVGLGDYAPTTTVARGLLFPFVIGGVLIVGLVVGSIRSLILERGKEKMSARIMEKRRRDAVRNVDSQRGVIRITYFSRAYINLDPELSTAQRREEEFNVMRKVLDVSTNERRYYALAASTAFALALWFLGAVVFWRMEQIAHWTYFESVYFSFTSLMTIGYGDFYPDTNGGKAFFVFWSLLAVPSLTILISNMGDTVVKMVSDLTNWIGRLTVLPEDGGLRANMKKQGMTTLDIMRNIIHNFSGPGLFGAAPQGQQKRMSSSEYEERTLDRLAGRLVSHIDRDDRSKFYNQDPNADNLDNDIEFYNYVMARECRNLQKDLAKGTSKQYDWADWEYYLKLMGDEEDPEDYPGQEQPDILVPDALRAPKDLSFHPDAKDEPSSDEVGNERGVDDKDVSSSEGDGKYSSFGGNIDRRRSLEQNLEKLRAQYKEGRSRGPRTEHKYPRNWSWLSNESPLLSNKSETWWLLERLSAALERELNRRRKGYRTRPPISLRDAYRTSSSYNKKKDSAQEEEDEKVQQNLEKAAESAE